MIAIDLTPAETEALRDMLSGMLSELRMEIADTDRLEFREMLRARKQLLQRVIDALGPLPEQEIPS